MSSPQAVTERYVSNLLHYGRNKEFDIIEIHQHENIVDGFQAGFYYQAIVTQIAGEQKNACGPTLSGAVRNCLKRHGVTFR